MSLSLPGLFLDTGSVAGLTCYTAMRPDFSTQEAEQFARSLYGLESTATLLASYSDQNFRLQCNDGRHFVLKITNDREPPPALDLQVQTLRHLARHADDIPVPRVHPALDGAALLTVTSPRQRTHHMIWMVTFLSGSLLSSIDQHPPEILTTLGSFLGKLDRTLSRFSHAAMHRFMPWDLKQTGLLQANIDFIEDADRRKLAAHSMDRFSKVVLPQGSALRSSVIHNDANDNNILITSEDRRFEVAGLIDFGDMVHTYTICELAIAIAYVIMGKSNALETAGYVLNGYHHAYPVTQAETDLLFDLICTRLCMSVCMSARERRKDPDNEYLAVSELPAWTALDILSNIDPEKAKAFFRSVTKTSQ